MNLREFRYSKGLQRQYVSSQIDISGKHLNDIEIGKVNLTDKIASKLSTLYNVEISTIKSMYEEGKNEKKRNTKKTSAAS